MNSDFQFQKSDQQNTIFAIQEDHREAVHHISTKSYFCDKFMKYLGKLILMKIDETTGCNKKYWIRD